MKSIPIAKLFGVIVLALGLAACNTTTGAQSPSVGTAAAPKTLPPLGPRVTAFTRDAGAAGFLADACPGIRLKDRTRRALVSSQVDAWVDEGYSKAQIDAAVASNDKRKAGQASVDYLSKRGARPGDLASVCRVAKREIAENTSIGRMLRG